MITSLKLTTYNIDGLPETIDLKDLPWIFQPIVWIYKLIKGTTLITVNDNTNVSKNIKIISSMLNDTNADVIGVQEDFNYHDVLMSELVDTYNFSTYTGGFDLKAFFRHTEWKTRFPFPRFKCDGLNLISNNSRVKVISEDIVTWNKSCGYFKHANDALTHKGFRFNEIKLDGKVNIDVYTIHMDADFYDEVTSPNVYRDIKARKEELKQLVDYIKKRNINGAKNPILIMGDTNTSNNYSWDVNNLSEYLIKPINSIPGFKIKEAIANNMTGVDRVYYINNTSSNVKLSVKECFFDGRFNGLSDHNPLTAVFSVETES